MDIQDLEITAIVMEENSVLRLAHIKQIHLLFVRNQKSNQKSKTVSAEARVSPGGTKGKTCGTFEHIKEFLTCS